MNSNYYEFWFIYQYQYKAEPESEFWIEKLAKSKAWGLDDLPEELFKGIKMNDEIIKKIEKGIIPTTH